MTFRRLTKEDEAQLEELIAVVEEALPQKIWWIPIHKGERERFFREESVCFLGAFDGERLAGTCGLFFDEEEYGDVAKELGITEGSIAELGRCMVHPDYRGQHLMAQLNERLIAIAKEMGLSHLEATVHPDNTPSNRSFQKIGMTKKCTFIRSGSYPRNVYYKCLM